MPESIRQARARGPELAAETDREGLVTVPVSQVTEGALPGATTTSNSGGAATTSGAATTATGGPTIGTAGATIGTGGRSIRVFVSHPSDALQRPAAL